MFAEDVNLLEGFDGTSRRPRPIQTAALSYIQQTYENKITALQLGTGAGKSGIGVAVIRHFGGVYCVSSNNLMDQLIRDYPDINYLKGAEHYDCDRIPGLTCPETAQLTGEHCDTCAYARSVKRCLSGEPSFVNPFSLYYLKFRLGYTPPPVLVVDEAHLLRELLDLLCGEDIAIRRYDKPSNLSAEAVITWLRGLVTDLKDQKTKEHDDQVKAKLDKTIEKFSFIARLLETEQQNFVISQNTTHTSIKPLQLPQRIIDSFFDSYKTIMMSATIDEMVIQELLGDIDFDIKFFGSPIPHTSRTLLLKPPPFKVNYKTPPKSIAMWISSIIKKYPGRNTVVHMTYADIQKIKEFFPSAIHMEKETKRECIEKFKREGGVLFAAGCAEGVDFPYDECRLNIIPRLLKPNLGDPVVEKRKSLEDGSLWYNLKTVNTLIQQVGRSTRAEDDESISVCGDSNASWMIKSVKQYVPEDFLKTIKWR